MSEVARLVEALFKVPRLVVLGAVGSEHVVYATNEPGSYELRLLNARSMESRPIARGVVPWNVGASRLGHSVYYLRDETGGREQHSVYLYDLWSGEVAKVADELGRVWSLVAHRDVAYATYATGDRLKLARIDSEGVHDLVDLNTIVYLSDANDRYVVGEGSLKGDPRSAELFIYDLKTGDITSFTPAEGSRNKDPKFYGSDRIVFESDFEGRNALYSLSLPASKVERVDFPYGDYRKFSPSEHLYHEHYEGASIVIGKRDGRRAMFVNGKLVQTEAGGPTSAVAQAWRIFYVAEGLASPPKLYAADMGTGESRLVVDNPLPQEVSRALGEAGFARIRSKDGVEVPTFYVESRLAGRPGPTVIYVHGGPWSEVQDAWSPTTLYPVLYGYHVVAPNFRGSTGYGEAFRVMDIGDPGGMDLEDVEAAARWAVESGLADAARLVIHGYSYGGYMTFLAVGKKPDLWRCGVAGAGITDWEEMYGLSDAAFRKFIEILFAGRMDLLKERSPITYVDNVKAKLCIVHPQNDTRTPLKPVLRYVQRLHELGKEFELHVVPGAGHALTDLEKAVALFASAALCLEKCRE
ncbi:MAG: S9 family peptidase [Desulfurococcaceae archaeon]